jgi:hypothetical protein
MIQYGSDNISPAESTRHSWELEKDREDRAHQLTLARLNLQVAREENRYNQLFRVPLTIIRLPVYMIMAFGYIVAMARGKEVAEAFWYFIEK